MTEIRDVLAHRYPMLLVDAVWEHSPGREIRTIKAISRNEPWYQDGDGPYPPVLLVESWAQSAGLLGGERADDRTMLLGAVTGVEFHRPVHPGEVVEHRLKLAAVIGDMVVFTGGSSVAGQPVLTVSRLAVTYQSVHKGE